MARTSKSTYRRLLKGAQKAAKSKRTPAKLRKGAAKAVKTLKRKCK